MARFLHLTQFSFGYFYIHQLGLEVERVTVRQVAINEYHKIPEIINGFVEEIVEEIIEKGHNPFKGF